MDGAISYCSSLCTTLRCESDEGMFGKYRYSVSLSDGMLVRCRWICFLSVDFPSCVGVIPVGVSERKLVLSSLD